MTYLEKILEEHRSKANEDSRSFKSLYEEAVVEKPTKGFINALNGQRKGEIAVIAEVKRKSPSKGNLVSELNPSLLATEYENGGAAAISVLTEEKNFSGSKKDLIEVSNSVNLPILRKDFTVDLRDICDARIMGADAVLLIVAALDQFELRDFIDLSIELDLDPLVEIHDERELDLALEVGAKLIGVNQRDLKSFEVDSSKAVNLKSKIPESVTAVAESGIDSAESAAILKEAGYSALLVGELLVKSKDRAKTLLELANKRVE